MYIDRAVVAEMLEIQTTKIKATRLEQDVIQVTLWGSKEKPTVNLKQYMDLYKQRLKQPKTNNEESKQNILQKARTEINTQQIFTNTSQKKYEYLIARYDYIGRGITGEFNFLDINGERVLNIGGQGDIATWGDREVDLFRKLGNAGWRLVDHSVVDKPENVTTTYHYAKFIRDVE